MSHFVLGITGASGMIYAARTLHHLKSIGHSVTLIFSSVGKETAAFEGYSALADNVDSVWDNGDFFKPGASGNASVSGMAIVPCSMGSVAKVANGMADTLLLRTADVCLKEKRPLVLVPREMPYNLIHLENMKKVLKAGAVIIPASPHFYTNPQTFEDLADTVAAKILTHLGVENQIVKPWGEDV